MVPQYLTLDFNAPPAIRRVRYTVLGLGIVALLAGRHAAGRRLAGARTGACRARITRPAPHRPQRRCAFRTCRWRRTSCRGRHRTRLAGTVAGIDALDGSEPQQRHRAGSGRARRGARLDPDYRRCAACGGHARLPRAAHRTGLVRCRTDIAPDPSAGTRHSDPLPGPGAVDEPRGAFECRKGKGGDLPGSVDRARIRSRSVAALPRAGARTRDELARRAPKTRHVGRHAEPGLAGHNGRDRTAADGSRHRRVLVGAEVGRGCDRPA